MNLKTILIALLMALASPHGMATSFDEIKPRLQKILQCDPTEFPKTKKQTASLVAFEIALRQTGAIKKAVGDGGVEDMVTYKLPGSVSVFGYEVVIVDSYDAPFISITFPVAATELIKNIQAKSGLKIKRDNNTNTYEQTPKYTSKVDGSKYAIQHGISVVANGRSSSSYICNYTDTDPNIGG